MKSHAIGYVVAGIFALLSLLLFPFAFYQSLVKAPPEATMGHAMRIFYIHFPMAILTFTGYGACALFSFVYLWKRTPELDVLAVAGAEVGVLFNTLVLATGMIWAKYAWGTWWTWDPRLTATFILWFLFIGYHLLRASLENPEVRARFSAVLAILATLDIPIIFLSVRIWRGIHPNVLQGPNKIQMEPAMIQAWLTSLLAFWIFGLAILIFRSLLGLQELQRKPVP